MKLTSESRNSDAIRWPAIPEDHQLVPRLNERYGDHTFLDINGLNIVELADEPAADETQAVRVVNLANWAMRMQQICATSPNRPKPSSSARSLTQDRQSAGGRGKGKPARFQNSNPHLLHSVADVPVAIWEQTRAVICSNRK